MKFEEILRRAASPDIPKYSISWVPPEGVADASRVIKYLEGHPVLYAPLNLWIDDAANSIIKIIHFLSVEIANLKKESKLLDCLKALRAACRQFLDIAQYVEQYGPERQWLRGLNVKHMEVFALFRLRVLVGIYIIEIAIRYGLDIEDDLASILPPVNQSEDN